VQLPFDKTSADTAPLARRLRRPGSRRIAGAIAAGAATLAAGAALTLSAAASATAAPLSNHAVGAPAGDTGWGGGGWTPPATD